MEVRRAGYSTLPTYYMLRFDGLELIYKFKKL